MIEEMTQRERELIFTKEFIETVVSSVETIRIYPRRNVHLDVVLLILLLRCVRAARAVCILAEQEMGDGAFVLSRTALEICVTARYIANTNSEDRAIRYVEYFGKDRERLSQLIRTYQPSAASSFSPDHEQLLSMANKFKSPHAWIDGGLRTMAYEPLKWSVEDARQGEYWYDVIYRLASHESHCTSAAAYWDLAEFGHSVAGLNFPFTFWQSKTSESNRSRALFNAFFFTAECLRHVFHGLREDPPPAITTKRQAVDEVFRRNC